MQISITSPNFTRAISRLKRVPKVVKADLPARLRDVGLHWKREAQRNSPELKGIRGGIVAHLTTQVGNDYVKCFVPINSPAGIYAPIMHKHEGNWGEITRSKGARAGNRYIVRARDDNVKRYVRMIGRVFDRV